jgi:hypothetical protein
MTPEFPGSFFLSMTPVGEPWPEVVTGLFGYLAFTNSERIGSKSRLVAGYQRATCNFLQARSGGRPPGVGQRVGSALPQRNPWSRRRTPTNRDQVPRGVVRRHGNVDRSLILDPGYRPYRLSRQGPIATAVVLAKSRETIVGAAAMMKISPSSRSSLCSELSPRSFR